MNEKVNPNILYPTQKAPIAGNPSDSAYAQMLQNSNSQNDLNNSFKGGKYKKNKGGGYEAPQMVMPYNTGGTNPNDVIAGNTQLSVQGGENAQYDYLALQKGGNPNWHWGCYSGGKRRTTKNRKTKNRKTKNRKTKNRTTKNRTTKNRKTNNKKMKNRKTNKKH
jgi:hypothetical protein